MPKRIPIALLRQVCYPTSYRLPALTRLPYQWKPPAPPPLPVHTGAPRWIAAPIVYKGNLPNDEYRFFVGRYHDKDTTSQCRWCLEIFHSSQQRKAHKGAGCKDRLVCLYRELLKQAVCIMCSASTKRQYWGIPLCDDACQNNWKFGLSPLLRQKIRNAVDAEAAIEQLNLSLTIKNSVRL